MRRVDGLDLLVEVTADRGRPHQALVDSGRHGEVLVHLAIAELDDEV